MWRSLQFIPASSEKMLGKAAASQADGCIFDLEDSVTPGEKDRARQQLGRFLKTFSNPGGCGIIVRINSLDTWGESDLKVLSSEKRIDAFMLPKADCGTVKCLAEKLDTAERREDFPAGKFGIIPLIETVSGVFEACQIARASERVLGMLFGAEDYSAQMGLTRTAEGNEIYVARNLCAMACRAAGVQAFDTPFTDIRNLQALMADARRGKEIGMTGKAVIHPNQAAPVNQIYTPGEEEVEKARRILAEKEKADLEGRGAFTVDGKMVDAPIILKAENTLKLYNRIMEKQEKSEAGKS